MMNLDTGIEGIPQGVAEGSSVGANDSNPATYVQVVEQNLALFGKVELRIVSVVKERGVFNTAYLIGGVKGTHDRGKIGKNGLPIGVNTKRGSGGTSMPISDYMRRLLLDTLASNINEVILGFDGTPATTDDGSAGRPVTLTPTITVVDDTSCSLRLSCLTTPHLLTKSRRCTSNSSDTSEFTPVARYTISPITKSSANELKSKLRLRWHNDR